MNTDTELQDSPTPENDDAAVDNAAGTTEQQEAPKSQEAPAPDSEEARFLKREKAQLFNRLKEVESKLKQADRVVAPAPSRESSGVLTDREYADLRIQGYNADQIEEIEAYAKGKGVSAQEAMKSPVLRAGLEALKQEEAVHQATPSPSSQPAVVSNKAPSEYRRDMSKAEKQAWFEARKKAVKKA